MPISNKFRLMSRVPAFSRGAPVNISPPIIVGSLITGFTLSVQAGIYTNAPYTLTYQWLRNGVEVADADDPTYPLTAADVGATITVREIASTYAFSSPPVLSTGVGPVTASNPIFPETQTITWGRQTPKGWGAHTLGYKGTGTLSITSGNDSGIWAISTATHITGANRLITSGTYGNTTPHAFGAGYTLTVTDGTYQSIVTIQMRDNEISTGRGSEVDAAARRVGGVSVRYGDVIAARDGSGASINGSKVSAYTQRADGPGAPTSRTDAGWVTVKPDVGATIVTGPSDFVGSNWYLKIQNIASYRYNSNNDDASSTSVIRLRNSTASVWVWLHNCEVYSRLETGTQATARNICSGIIHLAGDKLFLTDNYIHDAYEGIKVSGNDLWIVGNRIANIWNDGLKGQPRNSDVSFNFVYDKKYGSGVHGDFFQIEWIYAQGTFAGNRVVGNLFVRGTGTSPTSSDGQGIFWGRLNGGTNFSVTNDRVYGNLIMCAKGNGLALGDTNGAKVKWNTVVFGEGRDSPSTIQFCAINDNFGTASINTEMAYNICMRFSSGPGVTASNNLTTATNLSDYADIFANPIRDGNNDFATLLARWAPKVGGPADGAIKHGAITPYIDFNARVASFPDGFTYAA